MNCEQAEELLLDFVEGGLEPDIAATLRSHLADCTTCRLRVQETRQIVEAMARARDRQERALSSAGRSHDGGTMRPAAWGAGSMLGDFEIISELGRGGMGVVYKARQVSLNRVVALKVLAAGLGHSPSALTRFRKEAQAAAKLHHTNIVPVYAQGEQDGQLYYAMELVPGRSLDRVIRDETARWALTTETTSPSADAHATSGVGRRGSAYRQWARLISGVADGLEHAHRQGVIHRDIKPQNLLLAGDGQLHITDFGLARLLEEPSMTLTGEMVGTPAYMSPEQVRADRTRIDHRTDIFSLGVTLYELITGQRPFEAATRDQLVAMICTREPKAPRHWDGHIPLDLETICLRAMEKEPFRRYQHAGEMAADLRRFVEHKPIGIRRAGLIEKSIKWVRRHPALATIYALSCLLVTGAVLWRVQTVRAMHARANDLVQQAFAKLAYEDYRDPAEARELLAEAGALGPNEAEFIEAHALAQLRGRPEVRTQAIDALKQLCARDPDNTEAAYLLAWALRPMRREEEGRESLRWIQTADARGGPATAAAHFFRGQALLIRKADAAVADFRAAIALRRGYTQAMLHLGRAHNFWMYHHRSLERLGEQKDYLQSACNLDQQRAYPRYLLSIAYRLAAEISERDGNRPKSQEYFELALHYAREAQEREPSSPKGFICEAEYWEARGDYPRARAARDSAEPRCTVPDDLRDVRLYRARLNYWLGDWPAAEADFARTAAADPADPNYPWYRDLLPCLLLAEQGRRGEAVARIRRTGEAAEDDRTITSVACMWRVLGHPAEADALLASRADQPRTTTRPSDEPAGWQALLYDLCRGRKSDAEIHALLAPSQDRQRLLAAPYFFAASRKLSQDDRPAALAAFRDCAATFDYEEYCYLAKLFVRRMEGDPAWPAWIPLARPAAGS